MNVKAVALAVSCLLASSVAAVQRGPIIDMHLHAFGFDEYGDPPPANEISGKIPAARTDAAAMAASLDAMKKHGVVLAVASGPIEQVLDWKRAGKKTVMGGAYTGPRDPLPEISRLRELIRDQQIGVLGELGLQYRGIAPTDPSLTPYFDLAEEFDIPVALHTGLGDAGTPYGCCPNFRVTLGNPALLEEVLVHRPKLRIWLMHAGYPYLQETKALLYVYPQVYVDIAVLDWALPRAEFHAYLKALVDAGFGKRIMFGSDQMIWPETIGDAIVAVEQADFLTLGQKQDILYNNAARFLKLDQATIDKHHRK